MQKALTQGKIPIFIVSQMPKWRLIKAAMAAVRTGPVKNGKNSRTGPKASSARVPNVSALSRSGNCNR
jgi:hypothetical protein